jgi:hypothetical protein
MSNGATYARTNTLTPGYTDMGVVGLHFFKFPLLAT